MGNDIHYIIVFTAFFMLLGLVVPLINSEFDTDYSGNTYTEDESGDLSESSALFVILNIFTIPFWTFGFPTWVNLWILLPIRIPFIFLIARNIRGSGG
jgi:hypothetical protein